MEFLLVTPDKLKVFLDPGDLLELDITYDKLDYADPHSRQALISLLERGKRETGFSPRKSKLFIEVFPTEEGGCVISFTCLRAGQNAPGIHDPGGPVAVIYAFDDVEVLLEAAVKVYARYSHRIYKSSLYAMGDGYRLIIYPLDYTDRLSAAFLGEFAPQVGEGEILAAYVEEHGDLIIEDEALDTLARYF